MTPFPCRQRLYAEVPHQADPMPIAMYQSAGICRSNTSTQITAETATPRQAHTVCNKIIMRTI
jgi:hypothetical protein